VTIFLPRFILGVWRTRSKTGDLSSGATKKCHACSKLVLSDATKCRHCGERLGAPALVDPSAWNAW
jgi:rRNA maturation endonuclease Nob1